MGLFDFFFKRKNTEVQKELKREVHREVIDQSEHKKTTIEKKIKTEVVYKFKQKFDYHTIEKLKDHYIAFDVETTGLDYSNDRIIEVGAVLFENGKPTKTFSTLVNPKVWISKQASDINHITNKMIKEAPCEEEIYKELVEFLGDALNRKTVICAHNAIFDMSFLANTLGRLGYKGDICYVDTLSISQSLVPHLFDHKQTTVADYFGISNEQEHRAATDAKVCGEILWKLIEEKEEEASKYRPTDEEMEVCAFIQKCITKYGGKSTWIGFYKKSGNYVSIENIYPLFKFKFTKKGNYILIDRENASYLKNDIDVCTKSEGYPDYVRVYFDSPLDLKTLEPYFYQQFMFKQEFALTASKSTKKKYENSMSMYNRLYTRDVSPLINSAKQRKKEMINDQSYKIRRIDIKIKPVNNRDSLLEIFNHKNYSEMKEGLLQWKEGEQLRLDNKIEESINLFEQARSNGYCLPALYHSYAEAYDALEDYDNEIDILDEGISILLRNNDEEFKNMISMRNEAISMLVEKRKNSSNKKLNTKHVDNKVSENRNVVTRKKKRPVLQFTDDMELVGSYESMAEAMRKTGISSKHIGRVVNGTQKHAGGYVWKFEDE